MITPRFSCSQTDNSVIVSIYCPSVRASDVEINVDETLFSVHINPYFLRLNFSHPLTEDDASSAAYDPSTGYLTVTLTKEVPGQEFKDLDLLAKLLAPRPSNTAPAQPIIEVLDSQETELEDADEELAARTQGLSLEQQEILEAAENDWQLPQTIPEPLPPLQTAVERRYGFLDMHSGYFRHVEHAENEVNELGPDAETCAPHERRQRRLKHEEQKWDEDHYMADYADDEYIRELIAWPNPLTTSTEEFQYTDQENLVMLRLPRKEYLPTPGQTHSLYLTLLTLLFAHTYETRTTQRDPTPESAWTLATLTPAFSALDPPPYGQASSPDPAAFTEAELADTLVASYRRSLTFPLYRSFALAEACRADVAALLARGKRVVTRCLLGMKDILDHHDVYYVYSKIWVDDFCVWTLAYASDDVLMKLADAVKNLRIPKLSIGWELEELEALTREDVDRDTDSDDESEDEIERMLPAPLP
ncbi:SHQ1-domain-containing protein [Trametes versicolor FP-101664 SS1]|uniref:SHQ1-domain-containing protein n=1 Tax=Trametes versicolor (strain FP-101664) TaxID=717944 RepID=UPI0004623147|nr:SHQ1-domain-containing protein [Trametes versicolor FP-101664 SS1]EIW60559.1 SHQ1-domain-containing protein [Trametes versicolor FP-101664 SS1]